VLDEVEEPVVGPLEVLEDEHERTLARERPEEVTPRGERSLTLVAVGELVGAEPDEGLQMRLDSRGVGLRGDEVMHGAGELRGGGRRPVCFQDAGLPLDDLAERPEAEPLAVRR
jgi:hypothetical protein